MEENESEMILHVYVYKGRAFAKTGAGAKNQDFLYDKIRGDTERKSRRMTPTRLIISRG